MVMHTVMAIPVFDMDCNQCQTQVLEANTSCVPCIGLENLCLPLITVHVKIGIAVAMCSMSRCLLAQCEMLVQ